MKTCANCGETKTHFEFPINHNGKIRYPRNVCKVCWSKIVYHKYAEKMMNKFPDKYIDCNSCDRVYSKSLRRCPECKSINLTKKGMIK